MSEIIKPSTFVNGNPRCLFCKVFPNQNST
jgi:hypothetical protein